VRILGPIVSPQALLMASRQAQLGLRFGIRKQLVSHPRDSSGESRSRWTEDLEKGDLWITSFSSGGIDILSRDGTFIDFLETGGVPLNCVFSGSTLFVCDFGTTVLDTDTPMGGRLLSIDTGVTGMPLFKGRIALK
jgi:hypothetical protein